MILCSRRKIENLFKAVYYLKILFIYFSAGRTGITLEAVFGFWTGGDRPPPLGFPHKPKRTFVDSDARLKHSTGSGHGKTSRGQNLWNVSGASQWFN